MAILNALPHSAILRFGLAIRTRFIDELLMEAVTTRRIRTVLSVGCGLDTRPWRLDLPKDLRWIEVDFADMLDYKDRLMASETPRCRRERLAIDLNDPTQRRQLYEAAGTSSALMITEGLLLYLPAPTVEALAADTRYNTGVTHWISDITTTAFHTAIGGGKDAMQSIRHVQASNCLSGDQILELLYRNGWATDATRSYITDIGFAADRIKRMTGGAPQAPVQFPPGDPTGVHRFVRQ